MGPPNLDAIVFLNCKFHLTEKLREVVFQLQYFKKIYETWFSSYIFKLPSSVYFLIKNNFSSLYKVYNFYYSCRISWVRTHQIQLDYRNRKKTAAYCTLLKFLALFKFTCGGLKLCCSLSLFTPRNYSSLT